MAEVNISREEAAALVSRVAFSMNEVIDDMRGLRLEELPEEVERLSPSSGPRPESTSETPSPGAAPQEQTQHDTDVDGENEEADDGNVTDPGDVESDGDELWATLDTTAASSHLENYGDKLRHRRQKRPEPTAFVNSIQMHSGKPIRCADPPYPDALPDNTVVYLRTEIRPPIYSFPDCSSEPDWCE